MIVMQLRQYENVLRVGLLVFNITFGILSISLIALGATYTNELWWPRNYVGLDFLRLPTLLMLLGSLSLMLSVAGCVCAKSYNRRLLLIFAFLLTFVLSLELTISVICFENMNRKNGNCSQQTTRRSALQTELVDWNYDKPGATELEQHYKCCLDGADDQSCTTYILVNGMRQQQDCFCVINSEVARKAHHLGFFILVLAILQMIQISFAYLLQYSMKGLEKL